MKRWHDEVNIMKRNLHEREKMLKNIGELTGPDPKAEMGRFRKQDAYDCGNPHCGICHPEPKGKGKEKNWVQKEIKEQLD
jgi:hypothetical protein